MTAGEKRDAVAAREEFFTDAQVDFNTSFEDALLLEKYEIAQAQLDDFRSRNGESAAYLHRLARLNEKQGRLKQAYEIYKRLYYEAPVFMRDKYELERIQSDVIREKLNKGRALWNQIVARASRFLEENPDAHTRDNKEPYVKTFWQKQAEDLNQVVQVFLSILDLEEYEMDALMGLSQCYSELENKERKNFIAQKISDAKAYWKEMIQKRAQASLLAAKKQEEGQHYDAVIAIVNLGLETEPTNQELLLMKAEALQKLRQFHDALSCVFVVLKCNQNNGKAQRMKKAIEAQVFEQNLKDGLDYLYRAEQEKPGSAQQLSRIESALGFFLDALTFDPQNLSALAGVYRCLYAPASL
jgi:tetratricopeptide (TPR) repeat protein